MVAVGPVALLAVLVEALLLGAVGAVERAVRVQRVVVPEHGAQRAVDRRGRQHIAERRDGREDVVPDRGLAGQVLDLLVHGGVELRRQVLSKRQNKEALGDELAHSMIVEEFGRACRSGRARA